jgi:hypothetical protein
VSDKKRINISVEWCAWVVDGLPLYSKAYERKESEILSKLINNKRLTFNSKMGPRHSLVGEIKKAEKTTKRVISRSCNGEREEIIIVTNQHPSRLFCDNHLVVFVLLASWIDVLVVFNELMRVEPFNLCFNYLNH